MKNVNGLKLTYFAEVENNNLAVERTCYLTYYCVVSCLTSVFCPCSLGKVTTYICNNSKELKCDAGQLPTVFGRYLFQVRAELQGRFSKWVNADPFTPDTQSEYL